jgi:hypothetical protein
MASLSEVVDGQLPSEADVVITAFEVNELHGTGILLLRMFPDSRSIVSVRSASYYAGAKLFGAARFCLPARGMSRSEIRSQIHAWMNGRTVRRILCCPYHPEDVAVALETRDLFGAPLCTYLMDDRNVCDSGISDQEMEELISKSKLRLAISPEMRAAYEKKYRRRFWLLPPLVSDELIHTGPSQACRPAGPPRGVIIGNIWGQRWLDRLRAAFRGSGFELDWYCNQKNPLFLHFDRSELERDGIRWCDPLPESALASVLSNYSYAVVPSGAFDDYDIPSLQAIAELSLPSKIPFILATAQLPILVLGDARTAAARNVDRLGIGASAIYDAAAVRAALERLLRPEVQAAIRGRAADLARLFSARDAAEWIWRSLEKGEPVDSKFETLMPEDKNMSSTTDTQYRAIFDLTEKLNALAENPKRKLREPSRAPAVLRDADAIITHVEVSDRHGIGKLVQMMFLDEPNILSIRSANYYDGKHELGDVAVCIAHENTARDAVLSRVLDMLGPNTVRRVVCVPYFADDLRNSVAVKDLFGAPLCTYIMDDQNVCTNAVPDELMREALQKSALRLAISPEMASVYEAKYGYKMCYLPPLAPARLIPSRLIVPPSSANRLNGVVIGNIWGQRWVNLLRQTVRDSGVTLDWYCNGEFRWLPCGKDTLIEDSIIPRDPLKDDPLVRMLRKSWFTVLPTGLLDEADDRRFIAQLSLPSRVPYMMATSHIPVLVMGNKDTAVAHFVEQFGIGMICGYDRDAFVDAVERITRPDVNLEMRRNALAVAGRFSDAGAAEWIWRSLARGDAIDARFEDLAPKSRPDLSHLLVAERV